MRILLLAALFTLTLAGCKSTSPTATPEVTSPAEGSSNLSATEAQSRAARVSAVQYQLQVTLPETDKSYSGKSEIHFDLSDNSRSLRLDFFEGQVAHMTLNDQTIAPDAKKTYWIELPAHLLRKGGNTVKIDFTHDYSHQGQGLHQFVDPETKQVFLYTQFETFDANRFMPCFDQPDLRATLALTVDAPAAWQVISTSQETSAAVQSNHRKLWTFPATPPIATYLFSLHAGPYQVWTDRFENMPLRLFARPAMAKYVHPKDWFTITKQGLKFYNSFFAYRYPFKKYDQIVVPEFNAGAMENVAAVTFTEQTLQRSMPTRAQRRHLAGIILHEMAHMWFGDIVTMRWWNNLWLNESFATFMASLSMAQATEFKEAWQDFHDEKNWAYWEDGLVTTHPIEAPVGSVKEAFATFDGITYGKGASVLRQLYTYMSPEKFKKGLQNYIQAYAFKNADLKQFVDMLQAQSEKDLNLWADRWLKQSGPDQLSAKWTCNGDSLENITLTTTPKNPSAGPTEFRPQVIHVALFKPQDKKFSQPIVMDVEMKKSGQLIVGHWPCPAFVYPNYQDDGYAQVSLDSVSLKYAKENLSRVHDPLLRTMIWNDMWQMVRDTQMPLSDYIQIVEQHFPVENDEMLLNDIVGTISGRRGEHGTTLQYWPMQTPTGIASRMKFIGEMEAQYLKHIQMAAAGSDLQKFWFDSYASVAQTEKALAQLVSWSKQPKINAKFALDLDRRWALARQLARFQHPAAAGLITQLKREDPSERGKKSALSTEAVQPNIEVKRKWVQMVETAKPAVSFAEARTVIGNLFPLGQEDLAKPFANDFYTYISKYGNSEDEIFVNTIARNMSPLFCEEPGSGRMKEFLKTGTKFSPSVHKQLRVQLQEDERCQSIRASSKL